MDYQHEQWVNGPAGHHPIWDALAVQLASWAEPLFIAVVVLWFLAGWLRGRILDRQGASAALLAAGGALLINLIISHLWDRSRPFVTHPDTVQVLLGHSRDASFPSDHASAAFAIATVLFAAHRGAGLAALTFAALMSYARVYVGDHYPGDVLAGAVIGLIMGGLLVSRLDPIAKLVIRLIDTGIRLVHLPLPDRPDSSPATRI